jgi:hypothetical protein
MARISVDWHEFTTEAHLLDGFNTTTTPDDQTQQRSAAVSSSSGLVLHCDGVNAGMVTASIGFAGLGMLGLYALIAVVSGLQLV